jgi:hypothetical protein
LKTNGKANMKTIKGFRLQNYGVGFLGCWLGLALQLSAQTQRPQTATGGPTRTTGSSTSGTGATRQYSPNGTVGDATITSDPETRRLAAYVLGEIGPQAKDALPGLKALLNDPDRQVVMQAVNSVRSVDPTASGLKNVTVSGEQ